MSWLTPELLEIFFVIHDEDVFHSHDVRPVC